MIPPPCVCGKPSCHICRVIKRPEYQRLYGLLPSLPVCPYEGTVVRVECPYGNADRHVRDCEHPDADWDRCMRKDGNEKDGIHNCATCKIRPTPAG